MMQEQEFVHVLIAATAQSNGIAERFVARSKSG